MNRWWWLSRPETLSFSNTHVHTRTLVPLPAPPWQSRRFEKFIAVRWNVELSPLAHTPTSLPSPCPPLPDGRTLTHTCTFDTELSEFYFNNSSISCDVNTEILIHSSKKCACDCVQTNKHCSFFGLGGAPSKRGQSLRAAVLKPQSQSQALLDLSLKTNKQCEYLSS